MLIIHSNEAATHIDMKISTYRYIVLRDTIMLWLVLNITFVVFYCIHIYTVFIIYTDSRVIVTSVLTRT